MQTTLTLPDDVADAIRKIVAPYRGSVPGYASKLAEDFAKLTPADRAELHALLEIKLKRLADREPAAAPTSRDIGGVPAIPHR